MESNGISIEFVNIGIGVLMCYDMKDFFQKNLENK